LNDKKPALRFLLDEGVPRSAGDVLEKHGHEVIYFEEALQKGSADQVVCKAAIINDAILVALDGDMKQIAREHGVGSGRFKKLNLLKISCSEPQAAKRLEQTITLIEHEWNVSDKKQGRRLFVEISKTYVKSNR